MASHVADMEARLLAFANGSRGSVSLPMLQAPPRHAGMLVQIRKLFVHEKERERERATIHLRSNLHAHNDLRTHAKPPTRSQRFAAWCQTAHTHNEIVILKRAKRRTGSQRFAEKCGVIRALTTIVWHARNVERAYNDALKRAKRPTRSQRCAETREAPHALRTMR